MHVALAKILSIEGTTDPIFVISGERFVSANPAALQLLGLKTSEELIGETLQPFIRDPGARGATARKASSLDNVIGTIERQLQRPDGTRVWVELTCIPLQLETKPATLLIARDVTARKHQEIVASVQENVLLNMSEGVVVCDEENLIVLTNPSLDRIFGYEAEELVGKHVSELNAFTREETDQFLEQVGSELARHQSWEGEIANRRRDGSTLFTFARIHPLDVAGRRYLVCVQQDLTSKKAMEARFLRSQRMDAIGALAGGIAHDLNNALAAVLLSTHLIQMSLTDASSSRMLSLITESTQRAADLVKQVLAFSRSPEDGRGIVQVERVAREISALCRQTFPKSVDIRTDIDKDLWSVNADPIQLYQALLNLCLRARDSMPEGGLLTINASNVVIDELSARSLPEGRAGAYVLLVVKDNGLGMTHQNTSQIFEPLSPQSGGTSDADTALSITHNIVRSHRGFLSVYSELGRGTEFKVYLPANDSRSKSTAAPVAFSHLSRGQNQLILVVDDEVAIRTITTRTLQAFGYRVIAANDGAQAVALCAQYLGEVEVMITDMEMPIMDGAAAITAVRDIAPNVKFIATTGLDSRTRVSVEKLNVRTCLYKPYTAEQLVRAVHQVLHVTPS
ncbi:MAG TPA: PAS domain S-box protein [Opitutaceae bacterium]|nr:PAS domain S-box protein [Opitutaceae bacterium]